MKIYVASSWRNARQPEVVAALRECGHEVFDFRNPAPGDTGFAWSLIDPLWHEADPATFQRLLEHPIARRGFERDMDALRWCDVCVLVLPCGRSAHLEAGWAAGSGRQVFILLDEASEPELMYGMAYALCSDMDALTKVLALYRMSCFARHARHRNAISGQVGQ